MCRGSRKQIADGVSCVQIIPVIFGNTNAVSGLFCCWCCDLLLCSIDAKLAAITWIRKLLADMLGQSCSGAHSCMNPLIGAVLKTGFLFAAIG